MLISAHASLPAADIGRARKFYADQLGLEIVDEREDGIRFAVGDTTFLVYESSFAGTNEATAAAIIVDDVRAEVARLREAGVEILEYDMPDFRTEDGIIEMPDGPGAFIKDTEGNIIAIGEYSME